jgi:hypothetical protein
MDLQETEARNDCAAEGQEQFNQPKDRSDQAISLQWRFLKVPRAVRQKNIVMRLSELGTKIHCAGEDQQLFSSR